MLTTQELLHEAETLPVEDRASLADSLLRTLNAPDTQFDKEWISVAQRRLNEIKTGKVKSVSGEEVFKKIQKRFGK
jgi:putative addiction module component (TIGR02574 family)